ncbi:MAG: DNA polymerase III subunit delta' [Chloroflexota bacterium]
MGQTRAVSLLQRGLERGQLSHAYLLAGPPHVGKMTLALNLAQALNCTGQAPPCGECLPCQKIASGRHADVAVVGLAGGEKSAEGKGRAEIGIDQIREVQHSTSFPPFEGRCRVVILEGAELISTEAANSLLKTLEEPVGRVVFVLLTTNEKLLPATVVSRCQLLKLFPLAVAEVEEALQSRWGVEKMKAGLVARLSHGALGWAVSAAGAPALLEQRRERIAQMTEVISGDYGERFGYAYQLASEFSQSRSTVLELLELWRDWWRDLMLVKLGCREAVTGADQLPWLEEVAPRYRLGEVREVIRAVGEAGEQLRQNASPRLALEVLMLSIPRKEERGGRATT